MDPLDKGSSRGDQPQRSNQQRLAQPNQGRRDYRQPALPRSSEPPPQPPPPPRPQRAQLTLRGSAPVFQPRQSHQPTHPYPQSHRQTYYSHPIQPDPRFAPNFALPPPPPPPPPPQGWQPQQPINGYGYQVSPYPSGHSFQPPYGGNFANNNNNNNTQAWHPGYPAQPYGGYTPYGGNASYGDNVPINNYVAAWNPGYPAPPAPTSVPSSASPQAPREVLIAPAHTPTPELWPLAPPPTLTYPLPARPPTPLASKLSSVPSDFGPLTQPPAAPAHQPSAFSQSQPQTARSTARGTTDQPESKGNQKKRKANNGGIPASVASNEPDLLEATKQVKLKKRGKRAGVNHQVDSGLVETPAGNTETDGPSRSLLAAETPATDAFSSGARSIIPVGSSQRSAGPSPAEEPSAATAAAGPATTLVSSCGPIPGSIQPYPSAELSTAENPCAKSSSAKPPSEESSSAAPTPVPAPVPAKGAIKAIFDVLLDDLEKSQASLSTKKVASDKMNPDSELPINPFHSCEHTLIGQQRVRARRARAPMLQLLQSVRARRRRVRSQRPWLLQSVRVSARPMRIWSLRSLESVRASARPTRAWRLQSLRSVPNLMPRPLLDPHLRSPGSHSPKR